MNTPSFLFVGTAKAGTTSVYRYLQQHPDISIPVKETFYFLKDVYKHNTLAYPMQRPLNDLILDDAAYRALYDDVKQKVVGEIGTGYLYHHKDCIPRILETLGKDVKILIILRHPTERCFSSYMHFVKDTHEKHSFEEALQLEPERIAMHWDFMWHHKAMGCYANQVEAYLRHFAHCKVLVYEEFARNPLDTMKEIFGFIGCSVPAQLEVERRYNPSGKPRFEKLQSFITTENPLKSAVRPIIRAILPKNTREKLRKGVKEKNLMAAEKMSDEMRNQLNAFYASDIRKLEAILGRSIDVWKR